MIDDILLEEFKEEMEKILDEKFPKYQDTWRTIDFIELKRKLLNSINTLGLTSDRTPRKLIHIANYCFFLYTRLKEVL